MATKEHVLNRAEEHEDRPGETLVTRDHDVIRRWAEARGAKPATAPGSESNFFRLRRRDEA